MILLQAADPDAARAEVRDILGDRRFRSDPAPRPFRGPLEWLGDRISTIGGWISDVASAVPWFVWLAIALAVFALLARWIVKSVGRRRARATGAVARDMRATNEDPAVLEREADDAERRGDLERAVRLRFRAGLLRLGDRGAIALPAVADDDGGARPARLGFVRSARGHIRRGDVRRRARRRR